MSGTVEGARHKNQFATAACLSANRLQLVDAFLKPGLLEAPSTLFVC